MLWLLEVDSYPQAGSALSVHNRCGGNVDGMALSIVVIILVTAPESTLDTLESLGAVMLEISERE